MRQRNAGHDTSAGRGKTASGSAPSADRGASRRSSAASGVRTRYFATFAWGITGFLLGAIFWHFIGFWGFVSHVVLKGPPAAEQRFVAQTGFRCVELVLDRTERVTLSQPCPLDAPLLQESGRNERADVATPPAQQTATPVRWTSPIDTDEADGMVRLMQLQGDSR